jgi:hypothetical protein
VSGGWYRRLVRSRWTWLGLAGTLLLAAIYLPHLNVDDAVDSRTFTILRVLGALVALLIVAVVAFRWLRPHDWRYRGCALWFVLAAGALLAAVYLPHLQAADAFGWLWGGAAEDPDKADAVTWARWVLVALAGLIVLLALRRVWLELSLVVLAALLVVAAAAASDDLLSRLDRTADVKRTDAAFDRGFALPAAKVQRVTRDLKRDHCVTIVVIKPIDRDGEDDEGPPTYESESYTARLISTLKAGEPSAPVEIELGQAASPEQFATDLVAASALFISSTQAEQDAESAAASGCP